MEDQKTVRTTALLPSGYREWVSFDLLKNKRQMLAVNLLSIALIAGAVVAGIMLAPAGGRLSTRSTPDFWMKAIITLAGMLMYIILHEAVHGIFMKSLSGVKPKYGFKVMYAYAGSDAYFQRSHYIVIALAPVVIWGAVLAVICAVVPADWFWVAYFIQVLNLSGAAGDLYVTWHMLKMPGNVLVRDSGIAMKVYSKTQANAEEAKPGDMQSV